MEDVKVKYCSTLDEFNAWIAGNPDIQVSTMIIRYREVPKTKLEKHEEEVRWIKIPSRGQVKNLLSR